MAKKNYKKSRRYKKMRRRKIIFGMEIAVLLVLSGILFVYAWINRSMEKMNQDTLDTSQIQINSEVKANTDLSQMSGTQVIALVVVDARGVEGSELAESMNSDTIILCCIDHDKQEIRMVSIMRDSWMNMAKYTDEYYEFDKANSAYNRGGPEMRLMFWAVSILKCQMQNVCMQTITTWRYRRHRAWSMKRSHMMRSLGMTTRKFAMSVVLLPPPTHEFVTVAVTMQNVRAVSVL